MTVRGEEGKESSPTPKPGLNPWRECQPGKINIKFRNLRFTILTKRTEIILRVQKDVCTNPFHIKSEDTFKNTLCFKRNYTEVSYFNISKIR